MTPQYIDIKFIHENPDNPRVVKDYKFKKLVRSIIEFPQMLELRPIVVNEDFVVLGGNMRLKACIEAQIKDVPVLVADTLTKKQQQQFIIKDNSNFGEWDWDMLANTWDVDELKEWGLDVPKWSEDISVFDEDISFDLDGENDDKSHIKKIVLNLDVEKELKIKQYELHLRKHLNTDNLSDTLFAAVEKLYYDTKETEQNRTHKKGIVAST